MGAVVDTTVFIDLERSTPQIGHARSAELIGQRLTECLGPDEEAVGAMFAHTLEGLFGGSLVDVVVDGDAGAVLSELERNPSADTPRGSSDQRVLALERHGSLRAEGDRRHAEYMQGADVVIHEAQYTPEEYPSKRHWGHSTYAYVVELAALAGVRRLFLTHHDPSHDDEFIADVERKAQELARGLDSKLEVRCAYEGCEITV